MVCTDHESTAEQPHIQMVNANSASTPSSKPVFGFSQGSDFCMHSLDCEDPGSHWKEHNVSVRYDEFPHDTQAHWPGEHCRKTIRNKWPMPLALPQQAANRQQQEWSRDIELQQTESLLFSLQWCPGQRNTGTQNMNHRRQSNAA